MCITTWVNVGLLASRVKAQLTCPLVVMPSVLTGIKLLSVVITLIMQAFASWAGVVSLGVKPLAVTIVTTFVGNVPFNNVEVTLFVFPVKEYAEVIMGMATSDMTGSLCTVAC